MPQEACCTSCRYDKLTECVDVRIIGTFAIAVAVTLGGCAKTPAELTVVDAVVRLSANPKAPSVAYFTVKGGAIDDRLLDVTSPVVIRTEMHESMTTGTMASMKPLKGGVAIPAGTSVKFAPEGRHVMLFDVNPGIKPYTTAAFSFTFASGTQLQSMVPVRGPGG